MLMTTTNRYNILLIKLINCLLIPLLSSKLVESITLDDDHHKAESVVLHQPSSGRATLIPGTDLHLQCNQMGVKNPNFIW